MNKINYKLLVTALAAIVITTAMASAQDTPAVPKPPTMPKPRVFAPKPPEPMLIHLPRGGNHERSIAVAPNASLSLRVNGWKRNEVRVFVKGGSQFGFNVLERTSEQQPIWLMATANDPKRVFKAFPECLWGEEIEIDLPEGASVSIKGQETRTVIDRVKKATVQNAGGNIVVRNVSGGVSATAYRGDITVEESKGPLTLESTTGNIVVIEAGPAEPGDSFKVKSNSGTISLQGLRYRQVEVGSISGSLGFTGPILSGANYSFGTTNGSIRLAVPQQSAFKLAATFAAGTFSCELPFKLLTEDVNDRAKSIVGQFGAGNGAIVKLTTNNGTIGIRKN
jgi:hypothetical protein